MTYPGEYRFVPEHLRAHGWEVVERNVVDLLAAMGLAELWRGSADDLKVIPRYVTATRVWFWRRPAAAKLFKIINS